VLLGTDDSVFDYADAVRSNVGDAMHPAESLRSRGTELCAKHALCFCNGPIAI
jgi:hypothetical protein